MAVQQLHLVTFIILASGRTTAKVMLRCCCGLLRSLDEFILRSNLIAACMHEKTL